MSVKVKDYLASTAIYVDEETITGFRDSQVPCNGLGHIGHVGYQSIVIRDIVQRGDVSTRDDENMNGGRGPRIPECHCRLVLVYLASGQLAFHFPADYAISHQLAWFTPVPGDEVYVQMKDHLAATRVDIYGHAVAAVRDAELFRDTSRDLSDMGQDVVVGRYVVQRGDVFARYDQYM